MPALQAARNFLTAAMGVWSSKYFNTCRFDSRDVLWSEVTGYLGLKTHRCEFEYNLKTTEYINPMNGSLGGTNLS